jgi:hypothetical protein
MFIADIDPCMEFWEIYVDPIRIFGFVAKKCSIPYDIPIYRVFKRIWKFLAVKPLISVSRKINPEITAGFRGISAIARKKSKK